MSIAKNMEASTPGLKGQHKFYIAKTLMPLAPASMTVTIDNKNEVLRLVDGRSLKILNDPGLTSYEFELIFPGDPYGWQGWAMWDAGFKEPYKYKKLFELLKSDERLHGRVFPFVIIRSGQYQGAELMQMCTLEDYKVLEDSEDTGDFRLSVKLERYVEIKAKKFKGTENADGTLTLKAETSKPSSVEVVAKAVSLAPFVVPSEKDPKYAELNTLWKIAETFLGDGEQYTWIQELNGIENPNLLPPGTVIKFA